MQLSVLVMRAGSQPERCCHPPGQILLGHGGVDLDGAQFETLRFLAEARAIANAQGRRQPPARSFPVTQQKSNPVIRTDLARPFGPFLLLIPVNVPII